MLWQRHGGLFLDVGRPRLIANGRLIDRLSEVDLLVTAGVAQKAFTGDSRIPEYEDLAVLGGQDRWSNFNGKYCRKRLFSLPLADEGERVR